MTRKAFRPIEVGADAGTHDDRLYNTVFVGWRANLRNKLLPFVRYETPIIASLQVLIKEKSIVFLMVLLETCP